VTGIAMMSASGRAASMTAIRTSSPPMAADDRLHQEAHERMSGAGVTSGRIGDEDDRGPAAASVHLAAASKRAVRAWPWALGAGLRRERVVGSCIAIDLIEPGGNLSDVGFGGGELEPRRLQAEGHVATRSNDQ